MNTLAEKEILLQTDIDFARTSRESNAADAFKKFLAQDCMMFSAGSEPLQGLESIYQRMIKSADKYSLTWIPQRAEVAKSADMGWTWGKFMVESIDEKGNKPISYGKYVNVWERQSDGQWKVIVDIGNESPAPGAD